MTNNGEALIHIMGQIQGPGQDVISVRKLYDRAASAVSIAAITRHSPTLREFRLSGCENSRVRLCKLFFCLVERWGVLRTGDGGRVLEAESRFARAGCCVRVGVYQDPGFGDCGQVYFGWTRPRVPC